MHVRMWAGGLAAILFAGCAADAGEAELDPEVGTLEAEVRVCEKYATTMLEHVNAGRVTGVNSYFFIWVVTTYYPVGSPDESLGTNLPQTAVVTLYPKTAGGFTSNPSKCKATDCGDGVVEAPEECDGAIPEAQAACTTEGYAAGKIKCSAQCKFDRTDCKVSVCGDGVVQVGERCDGDVGLPGNGDCAQADPVRYNGGRFTCASDCITPDYSTCSKRCGNGTLDPGEECDGTLLSSQFAGKNCSDYDYFESAFPFQNKVKAAPGPLPCADNCKVDTFRCKPQPGCYWKAIPGSAPAYTLVPICY